MIYTGQFDCPQKHFYLKLTQLKPPQMKHAPLNIKQFQFCNKL